MIAVAARAAAVAVAEPGRHERRDARSRPAAMGKRDADEPGLAHQDLARRRTPSPSATSAHIRCGVGHARRAGGRVGVARCDSTTAAARPPVAARWARLTCTGAAAARLAVKTPAAGTGAAVVGGHQGEVGSARRLDARTAMPDGHEALGAR